MRGDDVELDAVARWACLPLRDPELEQMLLQLDGDLSRSHATHGKERDTWWEQIEKEAAPYALAFYYEIRRLDSLRLARTSPTPVRPGQDSQ